MFKTITKSMFFDFGDSFWVGQGEKEMILKGSLKKIPAWDAIMGLQFENLVMNHFKQLYSLLGIPLEQIVNDGPYTERDSRIGF